MKLPLALSLHRPWTTLILRFGKNVENRIWRTSYRGPLLIHGAKAWSDDALDYADLVDLIYDGDLGVNAITADPDPADHPTGILGVVDLVGICDAEMNADEARCSCGPWAMKDQYHWKLANPRPFAEPVHCRGWQQLWTPRADVAAAVQVQLDAASLLAGVRAAAEVCDPVPDGLADDCLDALAGEDGKR